MVYVTGFEEVGKLCCTSPIAGAMLTGDPTGVGKPVTNCIAAGLRGRVNGAYAPVGWMSSGRPC
jgi:hypothetical protein